MTYLRPHSDNSNLAAEGGYTGLLIGGPYAGQQGTSGTRTLRMMGVRPPGMSAGGGLLSPQGTVLSYKGPVPDEYYYFFAWLKLMHIKNGPVILDVWAHSSLTDLKAGGMELVQDRALLTLIDGYVAHCMDKKS